MPATEFLGWWFSDGTGTLQNGDGRKAEVGVTHTVDEHLVLCERGLHASPSVLDALWYARGPILWRVRLSGQRVDGDDKSSATERTYLARVDAIPIMRAFARRCALNVIHLWDAPQVVRDYLETGDESLRTDARDAASAAAKIAASAAAYVAANAAANAATKIDANTAAKIAASAAAYVAARDTARDAAWDAQKAILERMCLDAIGGL